MPTSLGPAEILVILVVALMVLGPKRLPEAGRQVGRAIAEVRKWSQGFQDEIRGAIDPTGAPSYPPPVGAPPITPAPAPPPGPATPAEAEYAGPIPDAAPVADGEAESVPDVVQIVPSAGASAGIEGSAPEPSVPEPTMPPPGAPPHP